MDFVSSKIFIGIPSKGRAHRVSERKGLWRYLAPSENYDNVIVFITPQDLESYAEQLNHNMVVVEEKGILVARRSIFDMAKSRGAEVVFMMDDDLTFHVRDENLSSKYNGVVALNLENDTFKKVVAECALICSEDYPIVGLPSKLWSSSKKYSFEKNCPVIDFYCYHVPTLIKEGLGWVVKASELKEGRYTQLSLLSKGHVSISNCRFAVSDYDEKGSKRFVQSTLKETEVGGCHSYRTVDKESKASEFIHKCFPHHTELVDKPSGYSGQFIKDITVKWKKFLPDGCIKYVPKEDMIEFMEQRKKFMGVNYDIKS